jgi:transcriptional regulator with XRE-family HTH domain
MVARARSAAGVSQRQLAAAAGTSQAAVARYERGLVVPDVRTLSRLLEACGFRLVLEAEPVARPGRVGNESAVFRGPAIPDGVDDPAVEKAAGVVELPLRVQWSGPRRSYDLADRDDRRRVYELVLREGTDDDIRRFVRLADLEDLLDELLLPSHVRAAWEAWLHDRRARPC